MKIKWLVKLSIIWITNVLWKMNTKKELIISSNTQIKTTVKEHMIGFIKIK